MKSKISVMPEETPAESTEFPKMVEFLKPFEGEFNNKFINRFKVTKWDVKNKTNKREVKSQEVLDWLKKHKVC